LGVLNNDGQINVFDDTVAYIGLAVIGSGTITIARPDGNFNANFPSFVVPGPVAATQTVELDAGQLVLSQAANQPLQFQATIASWNAEGEVILPYRFHGDSLTYLPSSPGHGDLIVIPTGSDFDSRDSQVAANVSPYAPGSIWGGQHGIGCDHTDGVGQRGAPCGGGGVV